jgi:two-component system CheB/CheR fusion protein
LAKKIKEKKNDEALKLVARLDETADAMSGMLNGLLDINQIEAGTVHAEMVSFPIKGLLDRLRDEFIYHAQAKRLALRVVPCGLSIYSDPRLLEQMIRNLLSNALKYTKRGKVLLGCRRRKGMLSIEIWDTGIGIPTRNFKRSSRNTIRSTMPRANAAAGSASVSPSCNAWGICWVIG